MKLAIVNLSKVQVVNKGHLAKLWTVAYRQGFVAGERSTKEAERSTHVT